MSVDKTIIVSLINSAMSADYTQVRRLGNLIAKQYAEEKDTETAAFIKKIVKQKGVPLQTSGFSESLPFDGGSRLPLLEEGNWPSSPVILDDDAGKIASQFIEDAKNIEVLSSKGISSRLGLLLYGPPGTGKSLLAGHIAAKLNKPIYIARLDSVISSRLGDTAKNIRGIFEYASNKDAVLFLDEIDAVAKVRDDQHELGELKRVVNTVLQGLDSLSDSVITIGATNHHHLLDPAIWRRFPYKIELKQPSQAARTSLWLHFLYQDNPEFLNDANVLAKVSNEMNGAEIENLSLAMRRISIINEQPLSLPIVLIGICLSKNGLPYKIDGVDLKASEKKSLIQFLHKNASFTQTEISKSTGVAKQQVSRILKEDQNV